MKTLFRREYNQLIVAMLIFFGLLAAISSVSAVDTTWQPSYDLDNGNKKFIIDNKKYAVSWNAYRFSQKSNSDIYINKKYKLKNKMNKTIFKAESYYTISKVKKNRIKVTVSYSTGPLTDEVKIYKTKLSVRAFYWRYIETKFRSKFDKKVLSKDIGIDNGNLETIIPFKGSPKSGISTARHSINWKTKTYTKFPNVICIEAEEGTHPIYSTDPNVTIMKGPDSGFEGSYFTILEKTKKNKIKITIKNIRSINGFGVKEKAYTVKTNLSLKNYYFKVFKPKMVKMFSLS